MAQITKPLHIVAQSSEIESHEYLHFHQGFIWAFGRDMLVKQHYTLNGITPAEWEGLEGHSLCCYDIEHIKNCNGHFDVLNGYIKYEVEQGSCRIKLYTHESIRIDFEESMKIYASCPPADRMTILPLHELSILEQCTFGENGQIVVFIDSENGYQIIDAHGKNLERFRTEANQSVDFLESMLIRTKL